MASPTASLLPIIRLKMPLNPSSASTLLQICCTAIAVSGVFGDGFQTDILPQIAAKKRSSSKLQQEN